MRSGIIGALFVALIALAACGEAEETALLTPRPTTTPSPSPTREEALPTPSPTQALLGSGEEASPAPSPTPSPSRPPQQAPPLTPSPSGAPQGGAPAEQMGLAIKVEVDKDTYLPGEPIQMTLTVTNLGEEAVTLFYSDGQRYDFLVLSGDQEVWRWSADQLFAQVLGQETLAPGQSLVYREIWDQRDGQGRQVPAGTYTLYGESTACPDGALSPTDPGLANACRLRSNPFPFTIR